MTGVGDVRGLSRNGAMLQVISTAGVPERFKLGVLSEELHRMCRIAHKRDARTAVGFGLLAARRCRRETSLGVDPAQCSRPCPRES